MGGKSAERQVSLDTGAAVAPALEAAGHNVTTYDLNPASGRGILDLVASACFKSADVTFIALHGGEGEDGRIQAMLELAGMPYTGSGMRASALCMDKSVSKTIFKHHGIITPPWSCLWGSEASLENGKCAADDLGGLPVVVKPVDQGSTIGVTIVWNLDELGGAIGLAREYSAGVLLEKYIAGRELSVPIVGEQVFPIIEIKPKRGFYDYKRKYTKGMTVYDCPAGIDGTIARRIEDQAMQAFRILGCEGFARVDLRLAEDDTPYFLEMNTIPGMTETSLVPMGAKARGVSFTQLVDRIVSYALGASKVEDCRTGG
jgi:D-alanine-D-alanine ligase